MALDLNKYQVIEEQVDGGYTYTMRPIPGKQLTKEEMEFEMNRIDAVDEVLTEDYVDPRAPQWFLDYIKQNS